MKNSMILIIWLAGMLMLQAAVPVLGDTEAQDPATSDSIRIKGGVIPLPAPRKDGPVSLEAAINGRRSVRSFTDDPLTLEKVSQILWSAQGKTNERGFRAAPSAGALYPLETYLAAGNVTGLAPGLYRYRVADHALEKVRDGDIRGELSRAAFGQGSLSQAPAVLAFSAIYERTARRYGERAVRYVHMEIGHASQNVYLQAEALHLGTVAVGAFTDEEMKNTLRLPAQEEPLYLMPIGRPER